MSRIVDFQKVLPLPFLCRFVFILCFYFFQKRKLLFLSKFIFFVYNRGHNEVAKNTLPLFQC